MLKTKIELFRDGKHKVLLEWHRPDGLGGHIPIAADFADDLDEESRKHVLLLCERPLNGSQPGSSAHFLALPKVLERMQFRVRLF